MSGGVLRRARSHSVVVQDWQMRIGRDHFTRVQETGHYRVSAHALVRPVLEASE
jgi:hypothetical protein